MDSSTEELLLQKIEELVVDEDKIVTNSTVCEKFDIGLTEAKRILKKYVSDEGVNPGKISVTYLICGKLNTGEYCIQIVDSIVLKERRKLFSSISNEVVYSVQKSNTIDLNAIALAQKSDISRKTAFKGSIVGGNCIERSIKSKVLPPPPPQKIFEKQKPSSFFKPVVKTESNVEKKVGQPSSTNGNQNKHQNQKKTGGLAAFLTQSSQNTNNERKQPHEDVRETKRPRLETNGSEQDEVDVKQENKPEADETMNGDTKPNILKSKEKSEEKVSSESSKENKPSKKSTKKSTKKKQDGKKRKRIIVESDSEDDLFTNDEVEEKMEVDSEEEKPVTTQPKEVLPRNKRRKAVQNKYIDDEGFVVTKTEYVLVSASEDEETEIKEEKPKVKPAEKEEKKSPPQKPTAKGKKVKKLAANQTTLMSFFTKK